MVLPDGSVLVMGGMAGGLSHEVWKSSDGGVNWSLLTSVFVWLNTYVGKYYYLALCYLFTNWYIFRYCIL